MPFPLVAVDIGNTRLKLGLFAEPPKLATGELPAPDGTLEVPVEELDHVADWLHPHEPRQVSWSIGSVQREFTTELIDWLAGHSRVGTAHQNSADLVGSAHPTITLLCSADLPLRVALPRPDMVGIDRLLAAVAANQLREPDRPAVVVDLGTAVTVDLISETGTFQGGAILPGIGMSARALHEFTDLLPRIAMEELHDPPPHLGTDTAAAMRSGLFWGTIGAAREIIARMSDATNPQVFLTGGAAANVAPLLAADARFEPHLTLGGIAITAVGSQQ